MLNKLFSALTAIFISSTASAYTLAEVCFTDHNNACALIAFNATYGNLIGMYIPQGEFGSVEPELVRGLNSSGVETEVLYRVQYDRKAVMAKEKLYISSEENLGMFEQVPDEVWDLAASVGACTLTTGGCVAGILGSGHTFGASWWLAKVSCGGAAFSCLTVIRNYQKFQTWQRKQKEEAERYRREHPTTIEDFGSDTGSGIETGGSVDALGGLMDGSLPATTPTDWCQIRSCSVDIVEETPN